MQHVLPFHLFESEDHDDQRLVDLGLLPLASIVRREAENGELNRHNVAHLKLEGIRTAGRVAYLVSVKGQSRRIATVADDGTIDEKALMRHPNTRKKAAEIGARYIINASYIVQVSTGEANQLTDHGFTIGLRSQRDSDYSVVELNESKNRLRQFKSAEPTDLKELHDLGLIGDAQYVEKSFEEGRVTTSNSVLVHTVRLSGFPKRLERTLHMKDHAPQEFVFPEVSGNGAILKQVIGGIMPTCKKWGAEFVLFGDYVILVPSGRILIAHPTDTYNPPKDGVYKKRMPRPVKPWDRSEMDEARANRTDGEPLRRTWTACSRPV